MQRAASDWLGGEWSGSAAAVAEPVKQSYESSAGADSTDHRVDAAARNLGQNLRGGAKTMRGRVVGVLELSRQKDARLPAHRFGHLDGASNPLVPRAEDDLAAKRADHQGAF